MNSQDPIRSKRVPRFVEEYCKDRNGTQAAIRAGYATPPRSRDFYVYVLIDPRNDEVFYVGKGKGRRVRDHVAEVRGGRCRNAPKGRRIQAILNEGARVVELILEYFPRERAALAAEAELIRYLRQYGLTNLHPGFTKNLPSWAAPSEFARQFLRDLKPFDVWVAELPQDKLEVIRQICESPENLYTQLKAAAERRAAYG